MFKRCKKIDAVKSSSKIQSSSLGGSATAAKNTRGMAGGAIMEKFSWVWMNH